MARLALPGAWRTVRENRDCTATAKRSKDCFRWLSGASHLPAVMRRATSAPRASAARIRTPSASRRITNMPSVRPSAWQASMRRIPRNIRLPGVVTFYPADQLQMEEQPRSHICARLASTTGKQDGRMRRRNGAARTSRWVARAIFFRRKQKLKLRSLTQRHRRHHLEMEQHPRQRLQEVACAFSMSTELSRPSRARRAGKRFQVSPTPPLAVVG